MARHYVARVGCPAENMKMYAVVDDTGYDMPHTHVWTCDEVYGIVFETARTFGCWSKTGRNRSEMLNTWNRNNGMQVNIDKPKWL